MNYNSHTQTCLKNKSNSLHTGFNFACLHYIKICFGSIYELSWQAGTRKRGLQAVCVSVFSKIDNKGKKFCIYVYHAKAAAEIQSGPYICFSK